MCAHAEEIDAEQNVERYPFVVNAWNGQNTKRHLFPFISAVALFVPAIVLPVESKFRSLYIFFSMMRIYGGALSGSPLFHEAVCAHDVRNVFQYLDRLPAVRLLLLYYTQFSLISTTCEHNNRIVFTI